MAGSCLAWPCNSIPAPGRNWQHDPWLCFENFSASCGEVHGKESKLGVVALVDAEQAAQFVTLEDRPATTHQRGAVKLRPVPPRRIPPQVFLPGWSFGSPSNPGCTRTGRSHCPFPRTRRTPGPLHRGIHPPRRTSRRCASARGTATWASIFSWPSCLTRSRCQFQNQ